MFKPTLDMDFIKHCANRDIAEALRNPWLDPDTVKEYAFKQRMKQAAPFALEKLHSEIIREIGLRKKLYGT